VLLFCFLTAGVSAKSLGIPRNSLSLSAGIVKQPSDLAPTPALPEFAAWSGWNTDSGGQGSAAHAWLPNYIHAYFKSPTPHPGQEAVLRLDNFRSPQPALAGPRPNPAVHDSPPSSPSYNAYRSNDSRSPHLSSHSRQNCGASTEQIGREGMTSWQTGERDAMDAQNLGSIVLAWCHGSPTCLLLRCYCVPHATQVNAPPGSNIKARDIQSKKSDSPEEGGIRKISSRAVRERVVRLWNHPRCRVTEHWTLILGVCYLVPAKRCTKGSGCALSLPSANNARCEQNAVKKITRAGARRRVRHAQKSRTLAMCMYMLPKPIHATQHRGARVGKNETMRYGRQTENQALESSIPHSPSKRRTLQKVFGVSHAYGEHTCMFVRSAHLCSHIMELSPLHSSSHSLGCLGTWR